LKITAPILNINNLSLSHIMCGIFGYIGNKTNAQNIVLDGLRSLEYRGYDSWGIASLLNSGKITVTKNTGKIGNIKLESTFNSNQALGHTRWATHGGVTVRNAHPHLDCKHNLALIHNGIIENYESLKKKLIKDGHVFRSETDSETAVHLIEEYLKTDSLENAVFKAFNQFEGLNAIIVLDASSRSFAAAKNGSPLVIGQGNGENFLASDAHAILPYTNKIYFMDDSELVTINNKAIRVVKLKDKSVKKHKFQIINWKIKKAEKGSLPHFMLKEIYDQKEVLDYINRHQSEDIIKYARLISESFGSYLVGCGSAAYACLAGTYIFSRIAKKHINFSVASEFGYLVDFLTPKSLVIGLSQSGETIDLLDALKKAKEKKAVISSMVNVLGSTLYRYSDHKLLLNAGLERAVVSTKAFTAKLAYLLLIAFQISGRLRQGKKELSLAIKELDAIFNAEFLSGLKNIVNRIYNKEHLYIIGRGVSYPIALETAMKIKEASYIHAEGFAGGELKHGVIALIEKGTPCIAFVPNDETYFDTLSGVMEIKARGGYMIGIGYKNNNVFDEFINTQDCKSASVIPNVIIGQLLGYYLSVRRGLDPDKPRNLAKSVTVK